MSGFGTLDLDQGTFIAWSSDLAANGFRNFYNGWSDYLPGYLYALWLLGKINLLNLIPSEILYKLPAILADVTTGYLIYRILKEIKGIKWGQIGVAIYLFNPATFANSALWGQVDSFTALFSVLAVYFLPNRYSLSAISLAIGTAIKPQAAFIFPLILFLMFKNKMKLGNILVYLSIGLLVFIGLFIPFWNYGNLFEFVLGRLTVSANQYPYLSVNAFNFWGLSGNWKPDALYFQFGGYFAFLIALFFYIRKVGIDVYKVTAFIFMFSFLFFTRMHERHLLPVFAPLAIVAATNFRFLVPYIGLSIAYVLNLYYSSTWITQDFKESFDPFPVILLSLLSFVVFLYPKIVDLASKLFNSKRSFVPDKFVPVGFNQRIYTALLVVILIFSFVTKTYRLSIPKEDYFDEIYHAFTARIILHGDPKAWEWWNPHPEGFAYEWTHPPLSKLIMAGSMKLLGENSLGWRFPQAVFGTLSVFMVYLLAKRVFKDEPLALLSAFVFSLNGLLIVLSRMGMNDVYVLFFMLTSVYFFLKGKDGLSAISLGLAIAAKWSAIWTIPILFVLWLRRKKKFKLTMFLAFAALPITCYILTYMPMFLTGHSLDIWWGMQKQMWWYHTSLVAEHPYTSAWWSWPLNLRPVYLYTSDEIQGVVSRIYAMGNPLVFWIGLVSITMTGIYAYLEKNKNLAFLVFGYLIFFVPWAASPRIMFIYHYMPSIPFMCIAIGYVLRRFPRASIYVLGASFISFLYFYPHWAGLPVPLWLDKSYYWLTSWR